MKRLVVRILLVILGLTVPLTAGELYLRIYHPQLTLMRANIFSFKCFDQGQFRWIKLLSSADCQLRSAIGAFPDTEVKTNSLGLRNREVVMPKPKGDKRILFVGDSFTMGWGVKETETFPRIAENLLNSINLPYHVETVNAGFAAAGPSGYYIYLKDFGMKLDPDIVVVGLFMGNDITSRDDIEWMTSDPYGLPNIVRSKTSYIDTDGQLRTTNLLPEYRVPFLSESHLFIYLFNLFKAKMPVSAPGDTNTPITSLVCLFKAWCRSMDKEKQEVKDLLLGMKRIVETENHKKLLVAILPAEFQVTDDTEPKYGIAIPLASTEKTIPNQEFTAFLTENGIDSIDVMPAFAPFHDKITYFPKDDHWNPVGHAIAAAAISTKLAEYLK